MLKPEKQWRPGMTNEKLVEELNNAVQFPGLTNAWTMPIKTRIDMLSTGIKTPVGIKLLGEDLETLASLGREMASVVREVPGTLSVYPEKTFGGNYLDIDIKRTETMRYGLNVADVQDVIRSAVGGMNVTQTVEGLERYPVNVRYSRELRDDLEALKRILIATPSGAQIPLAQVADISISKGPPGIKSENARRTAWLFIDIRDTDVGTYVAAAQEAVRNKIDLPTGYTMVWSGQYEYMQRAKEKMKIVIPVTLVIIFVLLYMNFKNIIESAIVMATIPFALVGGIWLMFLLGYNLSVAAAVGFIALAGVAAETGVVMIIYLDHAYEKWRNRGEMKTASQLKNAVTEGAVERVRPKIMTVASTMLGLMPMMWGGGTGADTMKRIAAPMVGGMVSSTILTLVVIPAVYVIWKTWENRRLW
jgi:Cu(I)/Ag(I) efflux system membrane protein CusA/SilA